MNDLKALILAGGRGTRLMPITKNIPKPLVPLAGTPVIFHILRKLRANGVRRAVIATGHGGDMIRSYLEKNGTEGVEVEFSHESEPRGTAGAAKMAMKHFDGDFLLLGGDVFFDFDFSEAVKLHRARNATATVILSKSDCPCSFGSVCADENGKVEAFCEKPEWRDVVSNKISTGIYVLSPRIFDFIEDGAALDFAKDIFPRILGSSLYSVFLDGYFSDIGTIEYCVNYGDVSSVDVAGGVTGRVHVSNSVMKNCFNLGKVEAVRAGTVLGYLSKPYVMEGNGGVTSASATAAIGDAPGSDDAAYKAPTDANLAVMSEASITSSMSFNEALGNVAELLKKLNDGGEE